MTLRRSLQTSPGASKSPIGLPTPRRGTESKPAHSSTRWNRGRCVHSLQQRRLTRFWPRLMDRHSDGASVTLTSPELALAALREAETRARAAWRTCSGESKAEWWPRTGCPAGRGDVSRDHGFSPSIRAGGRAARSWRGSRTGSGRDRVLSIRLCEAEQCRFGKRQRFAARPEPVEGHSTHQTTASLKACTTTNCDGTTAATPRRDRN
jgi:hypothetical protein